jgi:hypothetical protein
VVRAPPRENPARIMQKTESKSSHAPNLPSLSIAQ